MGNVPAKEGRSRLNLYAGRDATGFITRTGGLRRNTVGLLDRRVRKQQEKDRAREVHWMHLVVRVAENVDGGFLAPWGTYRLNLTFSTEEVRDLIVLRRLAPFYTPLQDYDAGWSDQELLVLVSQLPLHLIDLAYLDDDEDDIDNHKIHKLLNYYRRQESKAKLKALKERVKHLQKEEEARWQEEKMRWRARAQGDPGAEGGSPEVANPGLMLRLYRHGTECPICFLYYPGPLNISRCCVQPICTECFVQIRRLDPHPPHDDPAGQDETPHLLILEPANCPYCALPEFGVTYDAPTDICVGIGGKCKPGHWGVASGAASGAPSVGAGSGAPSGAPSGASTPAPGTPVALEHTDEAVALDEDAASPPPAQPPRRRQLLAASAEGVITVDMIRPDWEHKLQAARNRLARKAATATAIHALNLLIDDNQRRRQRLGSQLQLVEDRMVEEAMRLLIIDEEERKRRQLRE